MRAIVVVACGLLTGCANNARVAGIVNGREIITSAPVETARPHLRDTVRKEDVTCPDEPTGMVSNQRQANQLTKDKIAWGRACKRASDTAWEVIRKEP